jgi:hypothetical protein
VPPGKGQLVVHVADPGKRPISGANVTVEGLGAKVTAGGVADFGQVKPGSYKISARKPKHTPDPAATTATVPEGKSTSADLQLTPPKIALKLLSIAFTSDHGMLTDHKADYKRGGRRFEAKDKHEWLASRTEVFPISVTRNTALALTAEFELPPDSPPGPGKITGDGGSAAKFESPASFAPGKLTVQFTGTGKLPNKVQKLNLTIAWQGQPQSGETLPAGSSGAHTLFITLDKPIDENKVPEDGVTLKRMEKAVELVGATNSVDPHTIVGKLMGLFKGYTLVPNPKVPKQFGHPRYFNNVGGAWPAADFIAERAECQAIVRFIRGVIKQVGCPGTAETIVVWADPDVNQGKTVLEAPHATSGGLAGKSKIVGGERWFATLIDEAVNPADVGKKVFPPTQTIGPDGERSPGLNNFEACLKFTHGGVTKYYAGGVGVLQSADQVLRVFHALIWVRIVPRPSGDPGYMIMEIVQKYR